MRFYIEQKQETDESLGTTLLSCIWNKRLTTSRTPCRHSRLMSNGRKTILCKPRRRAKHLRRRGLEGGDGSVGVVAVSVANCRNSIRPLNSANQGRQYRNLAELRSAAHFSIAAQALRHLVGVFAWIDSSETVSQCDLHVTSEEEYLQCVQELLSPLRLSTNA